MDPLVAVARDFGRKDYHNMVRHNLDAGWDVIKKLVLHQAGLMGLDPVEIWSGTRECDPTVIPDWPDVEDVGCPDSAEMVGIIAGLRANTGG